MRLLEALALAFQTLIRIPVPSPRHAPDDRTIALSAALYPLVGLVLGIVGWIVVVLLELHRWPDGAAVLVLLIWTLMTGALHEDGLADVADAMGLRRPREKTLAILKDSRVGAFGVMALVWVSLARWVALSSLFAGPSGFDGRSFAIATAEVFLASQILPRTGIVLLAHLAGPATAGSGGAVARVLTWSDLAKAILLAAVLLARWYSFEMLVAGGACLLTTLLAVGFFRSRIGGVTGDCLGATAVIQETAVLVSYAVLWAHSSIIG